MAELVPRRGPARNPYPYNGALTAREIVALLWVQVIGIAGVITIDRANLALPWMACVIVAAVAGWLVLVGPARRGELRRWCRARRPPRLRLKLPDGSLRPRPKDRPDR